MALDVNRNAVGQGGYGLDSLATFGGRGLGGALSLGLAKYLLGRGGIAVLEEYFFLIFGRRWADFCSGRGAWDRRFGR